MPIGDAFFISFLYPPSDIFTDGTAFFLGKGCEDGHHQFPIPAHGMDIFFLEPDLDALLFQLAYCLEEVDRISGKPLDGFGEDDVDFARFRIFQHPLEILPLLDARPGDAVVRIDTGIFPVRVLLNQAAVIADLCRKGMLHPLRFHGDTGIGCNFLTLLDSGYALFDFTDSPHKISSFRHYISLCLIQLASV
jgi:hypothetical protein